MKRQRIDLSQEEMPKNWYNIIPDLPEALPPYKNPKTGDMKRTLPQVYTRTASKLEFSDQRWIKIPDEVLDAYIQLRRPRPLIRAHGLEKYLKTPAKIYYKCEDLPPAGSFKMNGSMPQSYWAMKEGCERVVLGGGFGSRTKWLHAFGAKMFGLTPTLFMPRGQFENNKEQVFILRKMMGVDLVESPSKRTEVGRRLLNENPNHPGSGKISYAEIEEETKDLKVPFIASSKLNNILLYQTIIGLEVQKQLELIDTTPNLLIAAVAGASGFHGLTAPFLRDFLKKKLDNIKFLAVEAENTAKLTKGEYKYVAMQVTPMEEWLAKTYEIKIEKGANIYNIMANGLQSKDTAPIISLLRKLGIINTKVYPEDEKAIFEAAQIFLQTEGRLIAPESAYSVRAAMDEAIEAKGTGEEKVIVLCISANAFLDFGEKQKYTKFD
jgi:tryptophan synthase beta chain